MRTDDLLEQVSLPRLPRFCTLLGLSANISASSSLLSSKHGAVFCSKTFLAGVHRDGVVDRAFGWGLEVDSMGCGENSY